MTGSTQVLGIIGHPVKHSLSPLMQNAALQFSRLDYIYVPFEVKTENLGSAIAGLKALGVAGFNITIPHKIAVMSYLDDLDDSAVLAGAVNTVKNDFGRLVGYNTDGDGLVKSLSVDLDFEPRNSTIAVVGAGGAARGAIAALSRAGAQQIIIANRTQAKATELASVMSANFANTELLVASGYEDLQRRLPRVDLLINTTSLGMKNDHIPHLKLGGMQPAFKVYDMVYSPLVTPLLRDASEAGFRCVNGLGMLAAQGELAFSLWTGVIPPLGVMRRTLDGFCVS